jgi:hypothetical protein
MKPTAGKYYTINYSNPEEPMQSYMGAGECLQDMGDGRYKFILPHTNLLGFFSEEDVVAESEPHKRVLGDRAIGRD